MKNTELVLLIAGVHGDAVSDQALDLVQGERRAGLFNSNALDLIRQVAEHYIDDCGILGEQANDLIDALDEIAEPEDDQAAPADQGGEHPRKAVE